VQSTQSILFVNKGQAFRSCSLFLSTSSTAECSVMTHDFLRYANSCGPCKRTSNTAPNKTLVLTSLLI